MTFFVQPFMFDAKKSDNGMEQNIFPKELGIIPEFTVVDMHLMTSHNDTEGGYGCKLKKIELHHTSLYSYMGPESLHLLPGMYLAHLRDLESILDHHSVDFDLNWFDPL